MEYLKLDSEVHASVAGDAFRCGNPDVAIFCLQYVADFGIWKVIPYLPTLADERVILSCQRDD